MGAYDSLKSLVRQLIKTNGQNEITGQILQNVLIAMIDDLGITIDPQPTKDSSDAVASGGAFNMIQDATNVNATLSEDGKIYNDYNAGDIFYIEQDDVRKYRVAYAAGTADAEHPVTINGTLFYYADNASDAIWLSLRIKTVSTEQQSLSAQQKAQACTNIDAVSYEHQSLNADQQVQAQNNVMGKAYSSDASVHSGLGKVYLQKNNGSLTQAMMQATNTVYVIQYDYTMSGNITVPAGCTLQFDGGSIKGASNYTLTLNDCLLQGQPRFDSVVFSGNIQNDSFDATWVINGNDIGAKLNYAQQYFKSIHTPYQDYELSTPVEMIGMTKVRLDGKFTYTGILSNLGSAIEIIGSYGGELYIKNLTINQSRIDYSTSRTINFIGIKLTSCNHCNIVIDNVSYFNENVRMQDNRHLGCSYNHIWFLENNNTNAGVRFYQEDKQGGGVSWVNENTIHSGRFCNYGAPSSGYDGIRYAIFIGGPAADLTSYHVEKTDTYDQINCITVENCSFEGKWKPIYSRKCRRRLRIINCREEDNTGLAKFVGENQIDYIPRYEDTLNRSDITECTSLNILSAPNIKEVNIDISYNGNLGILIPNNNIVNTKESADLDKRDGQYAYWLSYVGCILDARVNKWFYVRNNSSVGQLTLQYLTKNEETGKFALVQNMGLKAKPNEDSGYSSTYNGFMMYASTIIVPNDVDYVFVGGRTDKTVFNGTMMNIESWQSGVFQPIIRTYPTEGATADRPSVYPIGKPFFDLTLNKVLYYTGDTSVGDDGWVDANGANPNPQTT